MPTYLIKFTAEKAGEKLFAGVDVSTDLPFTSVEDAQQREAAVIAHNNGMTNVQVVSVTRA